MALTSRARPAMPLVSVVGPVCCGELTIRAFHDRLWDSAVHEVLRHMREENRYVRGTVAVKLGHPASLIPGYASLLAGILFFGCVQLRGLGLLGEYVGRLFRETKRRRVYAGRERIENERTES